MIYCSQCHKVFYGGYLKPKGRRMAATCLYLQNGSCDQHWSWNFSTRRLDDSQSVSSVLKTQLLSSIWLARIFREILYRRTPVPGKAFPEPHINIVLLCSLLLPDTYQRLLSSPTTSPLCPLHPHADTKKSVCLN